MIEKDIQALLYARVSQEIQAEGNSVSIEQQLAEMRALCQKRGWQIAKEYIDTQNYLATQNPNKGKIVNPSGERADRPAFLEMLEAIKTGNYEVILCWRDDRLVRHPRVDVALEDALDEADALKKGGEKIQLFDATGTEINRFFLNIVSGIWRQESKRRSERTRMGKFSTLKEGRWCGEFRRYGYKSVKKPGQRGREIELDPVTAPIVKRIFELYDGGYRVSDIRKFLIENEVPQIYTTLLRHKWSRPLISRILHSEEYLGEATWQFADGVILKVKIPQIIEPNLWARVQERFEKNKTLSPRNTKDIYPLQGLLFCGECLHRMCITHLNGYGSYKFGDGGGHGYSCHNASAYPNEIHSHPSAFNGIKLDWVVWRFICEELLPNPQHVIAQMEAKVNKLQAEGENAEGEIAHIERRIQEVDSERRFFQKKAAQGKISENEFDQRMDESNSEMNGLREQLAYLYKLRHDSEKVRKSLDYVVVLFSKLKEVAVVYDYKPNELADMTVDERRNCLSGWQSVFRMLIKQALIFSSQQVNLSCVVDGSEAIVLGIQGS
jgi:DNA invertase Pin-like site-specific DNA recombinase